MSKGKYSISIPDPCHEDWNRMSPEEQGRHCKVCCKTVIDFTGKNQNEVDRIIDEKKDEKICGRFTTSQLVPQVKITVPGIFAVSGMSLRKVFVLALFVVFGTGLFSCTTQEDERVGKIEVMGDVETTSHNINDFITGDTIVCIMPPPDSDTAVNGQMEMLKGEIAPQHHVMGGPGFTMIHNENIIYPEEQVVVEQEYVGKPSIELQHPENVVEEEVVEEELIDPAAVDSTLIVNEEENIIPETIREEVSENETKITPITAWPNPGDGKLTLRYVVEKDQPVLIEVRTISGAHVKNLVNVSKHYSGEYTSGFDLSDLPNAAYLLRFICGNHVETVKILISK